MSLLVPPIGRPRVLGAERVTRRLLLGRDLGFERSAIRSINKRKKKLEHAGWMRGHFRAATAPFCKLPAEGAASRALMRLLLSLGDDTEGSFLRACDGG